MKRIKTRIAAAATIIGLGGLAGVALNAGNQGASQPVAAKPLVRTKVIRRTIHVTKHAKPKHPPAGAGGIAYGGGSGYGGSAGSAAAATGSSSVGGGPEPSSASGESIPVTTSTSGAGGGSSAGSEGGGTTPVTTSTSGAGGSAGGAGGGEVEHESEGADD